MTEPSSIPERVTMLERQLPEVARKAHEASYLARKASEDVGGFSAKLDVHKKLIDALRQTQVEQGKTMDAGFDEMRAGFSVLGVGMAQIQALLNIAIGRTDDSPS